MGFSWVPLANQFAVESGRLTFPRTLLNATRYSISSPDRARAYRKPPDALDQNPADGWIKMVAVPENPLFTDERTHQQP